MIRFVIKIFEGEEVIAWRDVGENDVAAKTAFAWQREQFIEQQYVIVEPICRKSTHFIARKGHTKLDVWLVDALTPQN